MNYYSRHLGDYAKATGHLSMLEHGAYTILLDVYYTTEEPIPAERAHRLARARTDEERAAVDAVLADFFDLDVQAGVWRNKRADEEIEIARIRISAAQANGRKGGRPPKDKTQQVPGGLPPGTQDQTQVKAHQPPTTNHQETPPSVSPLEPKAKAASSRVQGTRLPTDWVLPKAWGEWALSDQPTWSADHCRRVGESFRDYWVSKPGKDATKLDWQAAWRNWVRKEGPARPVAGQTPTGQGGSSPVSPQVAQTAQMLQTGYFAPRTAAEREAMVERAREIRRQKGLDRKQQPEEPTE